MNRFNWFPVWFLLLFNSLSAQVEQKEDKLKVFVWSFTTDKLEMNELTEYLTEDFEEELIKVNEITVLQRRDFSQLLGMIDLEKGILDIQGIPEPILDTLEFHQADAVIFGELREDFEGGQRKVTVKIQRFNGEILKIESVATPPVDLFNSSKRKKAMKQIVDKLFPPHRYGGLGSILSRIGHTTSALIFIGRAIHFGNKANEVEIPPMLSEERVIAVGDYKRFKARKNWSLITAANLAITSMPFWFDLMNIEPRINKLTIAGIFCASSVFFFYNGKIAEQETDDILNKLETQFSQYSKDREEYWGKYQAYLERKNFSYINCAIGLVATIEILLWYNRNDETNKGLNFSLDPQKSINLALDFSYNKEIFNPQIGLILQASF